MSFVRGMQLGLGLVGAGYGIYRLTRGKRDWMTRSLLTTGVSMALSTAMGRRNRKMARQINSLVSSFSMSMPRFQRKVMKSVPQMLSNMGDMAMSALR